jgi:hypothetical protein
MNPSPLGLESELDTLLLAVFHAYRQGLLQQPRPQLPMPTRDFDVLMFLGTIGWLPLENRLQLRSLSGACGKGLTAARQGLLDDSLRHYQQAEGYLERLKDSTRPAWLLGCSTYRPGIAYLDFRRGFPQRAREHLDQAMDSGLELERDGLPIMQMSRIQQGHNLARMDLWLGQRESAFKLAAALLAYMESRTNELPYHHGWRPKGLQAVPRNLLETMIHQIVGETAGDIVAGKASAEEWSVLIEASYLHGDPEAAISPRVQYALRAQSNLLMNNARGYLRYLERFFRFGIRNCHRLWYAVIVEFAGFCHEIDTRHSRQIREIILRDSAKLKSFPPLLRDCLDRPATQSRVA